MSAEDSLKDGDLQACLQQLQDGLRANPSDAKNRIFLFQLLAILGDWKRALNQLNVLIDLAPDTEPMVHTYRELLRCEAFRQEVFEAKRIPPVFGDPAPWIAEMVQAVSLIAKGETSAAKTLRDKALEAAPASPGVIDGSAFAWIADSDGRLGPVLEAVVNGRYFWIPFDRIKQITIEAPEDLRDLVWMPATFVWINGGQTVGFVPTRYPGTESSADKDIRLSRKTDWQDQGGLAVALGQRVLATDADDHPLMDIRSILFNAEMAVAPAEPADG